MKKRTLAIMNDMAAEEDARQAAADRQIAEMNAIMADLPFIKIKRTDQPR